MLRPIPLRPLLAALSVVLVTSSSGAQASAALPAFKADPMQTSVSGLSSGAFMAVQYQVAFSKTVRGAGVVAGGPYYCAGTLGYAAAAICMGMVPFMPPNPNLMLDAAQAFAASGQIDPLDGLQNDRIYVFSGTKDTVVYQQAVDATVDFFKLAGVPAAQIKYVNKVPSGHALITPKYGNTCPANAAPYISHCKVKGTGYDQAGDMLGHIYGKLNAPVAAPAGQIVAFNQREFVDAGSGMAGDGYLYVPTSCAQDSSGCKVHVALHGCEQSVAVVGNDFYSDTGYNNWADSNRLLVLYPQVNASTAPYNPKGCWDWVGYTGPAYATTSGVQLAAIKAMVDRLTAKP
ncbi:MAG: depolymerase [Oxalobacteraceae bacterium]|nr:depolymerase [Oxalobacteraceae bacterium]